MTMYAQTEAGRKAVGKGPDDEFDIQVPGTVSLNGVLSSRWTGNQWRELLDWQSRNYRGGGVEWGVSNPEADDRFRFSVPLVADVLPARGVLSDDERSELRKQIETSRSAARILEQLGGGLVGDGGRLKDETGEWRGEGGNCRVVVNDKVSVVGAPGIGGQGDDQGALLPRGDGSCSAWQGWRWRQMVSGRRGDRAYVEGGLSNVFDSKAS